MGNFGSALAGVNTPEKQQADCDLALGLLVQAVANSRYASDTLIIITEDDVQDGPDHVDSHRGPALVVGPYVKQGVVVSTRYSQVSVLRTIEDILGTEHLNLNTAFQRPMADVFDIHSDGKWTFAAEASTVLASPIDAACRLGKCRRAFRQRAGDHAPTRRGVLGERHQRVRFLGSGSGAARAIQPRAVEGPDGQQALSGIREASSPATTTNGRSTRSKELRSRRRPDHLLRLGRRTARSFPLRPPPQKN